VLHRVCDDGAFAMRALDAELGRAALSTRDAALCTEIVYGSLRVLPELDELLRPRLKRGLSSTDGLTLAALRVAVYQLQHLSRVPTHAIVDEAVGFVRRMRSPQSAGFVNAVLRRISAVRPESPRPPDQVLLPMWLQQVLRQSLGDARAEVFLGPRPLPPPLCLATRPGQRDGVVAQLREALPEAEIALGALSPQAILVRHAGDPRQFPGYVAGEFWVQEEGAQLVALSVGARPGERIADLCAGHGGKALFLAAGRGGQGFMTAIDVDETKLAGLQSEFARLHLPTSNLQLEAIDLSVGVGGLAADFDRVLVDAPCTGFGTIHRRPELVLRLSPDDPKRMGDLQVAIATRAAKLLRSGGELFVAVCSPLRAEGVDVARRLLDTVPELTQLDAGLTALGIAADEDAILRIGPWSGQGGTFPDAYQVCRFRRS